MENTESSQTGSQDQPLLGIPEPAEAAVEAAKWFIGKLLDKKAADDLDERFAEIDRSLSEIRAELEEISRRQVAEGIDHQLAPELNTICNITDRYLHGDDIDPKKDIPDIRDAIANICRASSGENHEESLWKLIQKYTGNSRNQSKKFLVQSFFCRIFQRQLAAAGLYSILKKRYSDDAGDEGSDQALNFVLQQISDQWACQPPNYDLPLGFDELDDTAQPPEHDHQKLAPNPEFIDLTECRAPKGRVITGLAWCINKNRLALKLKHAELLPGLTVGATSKWVKTPIEAKEFVRRDASIPWVTNSMTELDKGYVVVGASLYKSGNRVTLRLEGAKPDPKTGAIDQETAKWFYPQWKKHNYTAIWTNKATHHRNRFKVDPHQPRPASFIAGAKIAKGVERPVFKMVTGGESVTSYLDYVEHTLGIAYRTGYSSNAQLADSLIPFDPKAVSGQSLDDRG